MLGLPASIISLYAQYTDKNQPIKYTEVSIWNRPTKSWVLFMFGSPKYEESIVPDPAKITFNAAHPYAIGTESLGTSLKSSHTRLSD